MKALALAALMLAGAVAAPAAAQTTDRWDPRRAELTRPELQQLLDELEATAASSAYSDRLRDRAREEAGLVRRRLAEGDFQVGDRILLTVEGEQSLSDTFVVETGRVIQLPVIGTVPLAGVLRSEIEAQLAQHISKYLRDPVVHAQSLMRLSILGAVGRPGFYTLPTNLVFTDALMAAGGPAGTANLKEIRVDRQNKHIWDGDAMQRAITQGRTLDQMYLQAGDEIVVPTQSRTQVYTVLRTVSLGIGLVLSVYGLTRIF